MSCFTNAITDTHHQRTIAKFRSGIRYKQSTTSYSSREENDVEELEMLLQDQQFVNIRLGFTIYSITPGCSCNKSICRINTSWFCNF
ncbi:hypothetical protein L2E82_10356 [Cichorium intybus]|uniref:Uncharacterized protein n=1 Tax=Cichorium intybus TaxID=13427 RepID=A0ACB9GBC8_CICIN|nr:hypothetical protein L2E82_10356 [Cichorium intybus]